MADYMELVYRIRMYLQVEHVRRGDDIVHGQTIDNIIRAWGLEQLDKLQAEIHELNR